MDMCNVRPPRYASGVRVTLLRKGAAMLTYHPGRMVVFEGGPALLTTQAARCMRGWAVLLTTPAERRI